MSEKKAICLELESLYPALYANVTLHGVRVEGRMVFLAKLQDGRIFDVTMRGHRLDMGSPYRTNLALRRAFAKLAGIPIADLEKARKAKLAERDRGMRERDERELRREAERLGFRVTRRSGK